MSANLLESPTTRLPDRDPFYIGTRLVNHRDAGGNIVGHHYEPLTEADYLHPQEEDRFMTLDRHAESLHYLRSSLKIALRDQPHRRAYTELRIDWQRAEIEPHMPDAVVFENLSADFAFDDTKGTFPVDDLGADIVAVFEVTSASTRHIDFGAKFDEFLDLGIPYFIVIDAAAPNGIPIVMGFRWVKGVYRELRRDPKLGVQVPPLRLWFRWEADRLVIADEDGKDIPDVIDTVSALDVERAKAETEKARADALAREVEELRARLNGQPL